MFSNDIASRLLVAAFSVVISSIVMASAIVPGSPGMFA